jgi:hypothetical protein
MCPSREPVLEQPLVHATDAPLRTSSRVSPARIGVRNDRILGALLGLVALVVAHIVLADTYWNSEEGIYALSARLLLAGHPLYRETVAGQPPGTFLEGAALLAIHGAWTGCARASPSSSCPRA